MLTYPVSAAARFFFPRPVAFGPVCQERQGTRMTRLVHEGTLSTPCVCAAKPLSTREGASEEKPYHLAYFALVLVPSSAEVAEYSSNYLSDVQVSTIRRVNLPYLR